jgi:uncharacterized membrane protein YdjX (TVP38/TMEM64 family)
VNKKKLLILLFVAAIIALFFYFHVGRYLTLESLKANRNTLLQSYASHRLAMVVGFLAIYIVQTALSLPGAAILSLAAGAIFGTLMGTIFVNIGATLGATIAFLLARYLLSDLIQKRFGSRLEGINTELEKAGFNYLLFLRLVPIFPFFLINLGAGLTRIPLRTFFWGTMLGIIPGSFVYCNAGASLAAINRVGEIASPRVLGSFALLGLFALVPVFYQKLKRK